MNEWINFTTTLLTLVVEFQLLFFASLIGLKFYFDNKWFDFFPCVLYCLYTLPVCVTVLLDWGHTGFCLFVFLTSLYKTLYLKLVITGHI